MGMLTRDKLLAKEKLETKKVELGGGNFIYVRQMTGRERDRFEQSLVEEVPTANGGTDYKRNITDFRAKLAVNTVCDENGNNILNPDDYETLSQNISAKKLDLIINEAQSLNRISEEDKENLVKNSEAGQNAGSTSGLPSN